MKENSIEDIIEEKYTRYLNFETDILELTIEEAIFILEKDKKNHYVEELLQEAYKVILSDYKRVLKENEELNYKLHSKKIALEIYNRYIPKSKVEEKIEELDKEEKRELKGTKGQDRYYIKQKYMYKRKVLEDLLREE